MRNTDAIKTGHGMRLMHSRAAVVEHTSMLFQRYAAAGRWLREELREATDAYRGFLHAEAEQWQRVLAADVREVGLLSPRAVGTNALQGLVHMLDEVRRLGKQAVMPSAAEPGADPAADTSHAEAPADTPAEPEDDAVEPLDDYQQLTARAIVAQLKEVDGTVLDAVIAFEESHKQRLTVLRAAKTRRARLAA